MTEPGIGSAMLTALLADPASFVARYQPIVDLATSQVVAQAASVAARRGARVIEPPELFAMARTDDLLARLDRMGREVALRDAAAWLGDQVLVVRLLAGMVERPREALVGLAEAAAAAGIAIRQVLVEVGFSQEDLTHLARVVTHCHGIGCQVALVDVPDAETMRRSASLLSPDVVKPGRWLLAAASLPEAHDTVQAVHEAGSRVVAFGVEGDEDVRRARELGADWGQGWFFGRPEERRSL